MKNNRISKRLLRLENLEDRMLLAVTAGAETGAALIGAAQPTGQTIEITALTRTAINNAITQAQDGDTVRFANSLSGQTYTCNVNVLTVTKNITIDGNGVIFSASETFSRAGFIVKEGASVTFENFTFNSLGSCAIQGNDAHITAVDCTFTNNRSDYRVQSGMTYIYIGGGGIGVMNGSISVDNCTFTGNSGAVGGALAVCNLDGSAGSVTVTNSTFDSNYCNDSEREARGGAICTKNANIYVSNSTFTGNTVSCGNKVQGGAIYAEGNIFVDSSAFMWNEAVTYNPSTGAYIVVDAGAGDCGGAIFANNSRVTISNSLVANNRAYKDGGGIYTASYGSLYMYNCTVAANASNGEQNGNIYTGSGQIYNSILANGVVNPGSAADALKKNVNLGESSLHHSYYTADNAANTEIRFASLPLGEGAGAYSFANFADPVWKTLNWDYTLTADSAARNTGDDAYALDTNGNALTSDLAGNTRIVYYVDMGAYEIQRQPGELDMPAPAAEATCDTITVSWDPIAGAAGYAITWRENGQSAVNQAEVGADVTSYTITGVNGRRTYTVGVKAVGDGVSTFDSPYEKISVQTATPEESLVVTNLNDSGEGSLRAVLAGMNTSAHYHVSFADGLAGAITFESGIVLANGTLVDIDAAGITFTAAEGSKFDLFTMNSPDYNGGFSLTGAEVTGIGGTAFRISGVLDVAFNGCVIKDSAAAIFLNGTGDTHGTTLTITDTALMNNGGTGLNSGTGVCADHAEVAIASSVVSGNDSYDYGGGIALFSCDATITDTEISGNSLSVRNVDGAVYGGHGMGAGIFSSNSALRLENVQVTGNITTGHSGGGGGVYVEEGSIYALNTLVAGNCVSRASEAPHPNDGNGGGIYVNSAEAVFSNVQVIGNTAAKGYAGGFFFLYGSLTMRNCTVAGNTSRMGVGGIYFYGAELRGIFNSVISGNASDNVDNIPEIDFYVPDVSESWRHTNWTLTGSTLTQGGGSRVSSGHSLASLVTSFSTPSNSSWNSTLYQSWNLVPKKGAAIVDAGSNGNALDPDGGDLATDFRGDGYVRIYNGTVDLGAFELQTELPVIEGVSVQGYTGDYDGNAHTVTVIGTAAGDGVLYSADGRTYSTAPVTYTDPGTHTVYVKVTRSGYRDWTGSADVTINEVAVTKLAVSVVLSDKAPTITETPALPESITGARVGDTVYLQVWIKNMDGSQLGCTGGYIDLAFSGEVVTAGSYTVSPVYDMNANFYTVGTDRIVDFGGCAQNGVIDLAVSEWALLGTFAFTASAEGTADFTAESPTFRGQPLVSLNLARAGEGNIKTGEIEYSSVSLTVSAGGGEQLAAPSITNSTRSNYISFGANRHQLQWSAVANASGYEVSYRENGGAWKTVTAAGTKAVITGLTYGADVQYRVKALGTGAYTDSDWSAAKTFNVCPMDINGDGEIAGTDRALLAKSWMAEEGDDEYFEYADINADGEIAAMDRTYIANNWMAEAGDEDLVYPRPVRADAVSAAFASGLGIDLDVF